MSAAWGQALVQQRKKREAARERIRMLEQRRRDRMSIGADLPPAPIQCPMCRRWERESEMEKAVASCEGEPEQGIGVCRSCHRLMVGKGEVVAMMNGRMWVVGLVEGPSAPVR